jgi:Flp pilus assembly protein CpaB
MTYRLRNIGIAIALAVVAALLTTFYVTNYKRSVQHGESKVPVYVASRDIALGTQGSDIAQGSMLKVEQVSRRRFRTAQEQGVQAQLKGNLRALEVPGAGAQLLNGTLKDGDRVDILGSWLNPERGSNHISRVLLRNILVLQAPNTNEVTSHLGANPNEGFTVMLAMTDSQATKFWWLVNNGDWSLQLRPISDPSDSPEEVNNAKTNAVDGLNARQRARARSGQ